MIWKRNTSSAWLIFLIISIFYCSDRLYAQSSFNYNGPFNVGETHQGLASYSFIIKQEDTVKNGLFYFQQSDPHALIKGTDDYLSIRGSFRSNQPTNKWKFEFGEFSATDSSSLVNHRYQINLSGLQTEASGELRNGKLHGSWNYIIYKINNAAISDTVFSSSLTFKEGIPQKSFKIQNEKMMLAGRFLREGLAHDLWELYSSDYLEAIESWSFSEGVLQQIVLREEDSIITVKIFDKPLHNEEIVTLDDKYLTIIRLQQFIQHQEGLSIENKMPELLKRNAEQYYKVDKLISEIGKVDFSPVFKVKVESYPLTKKEISVLDSTDFYFQSAANTSQRLLENSQLKLLKFTDEEVLFQMTCLELLQAKHLNFIEQLLSYSEEGILKNIARDSLVDKLWASADPAFPVEVNYEYEDSLTSRILEIERPLLSISDSSGLQQLFYLTLNTYNNIKYLQERLSTKLKTKELEDELMDLENELIEALNALNEQNDSLQSEVKKPYDKALTAVSTEANEALKSYSKIEDLSIKKETAISLIECFDHLQNLALTISQIPQQQEEIDALYMDDIWNPFTATVMSEEVKTRLTETYKEILLPWLIDQVTSNLNCENVQNLSHLNKGIYQRMLELREEETEKVERKLRKEKDPKLIIELLKIDTTPKSEVK